MGFRACRPQLGHRRYPADTPASAIAVPRPPARKVPALCRGGAPLGGAGPRGPGGGLSKLRCFVCYLSPNPSVLSMLHEFIVCFKKKML